MNAPLALLVALSTSAAAREGLVLEGVQEGQASSIAIDGKRMRAETGGPDGGVIVYDGDAKKVLQIDPARKLYREMTEADLKAMRAELDRALAEVPPEMRAQMESRIGATKGAKRAAKYEKTGKTEEALGQRCDVFRQVVDGAPTGEVCTIPFERLKVERADFAVFESFAEFMRAFPGGGSAGGFAEWATVPGVPVISWGFASDGKRTEVFRTTAIRRAPIAAERFAVPAGFTKVENR